MDKTFKQKLVCKESQTAVELAVFGAILIFIIGIIIKQSVGFAFFQNNNLRATRLALQMSYKYSEALTRGSCTDNCDDGILSRNSASVLLVEDRLTAESAKYGAIDRQPQIAMGAGMHTRNLFQEFDRDEPWNEPIVDIVINSQHFPLTTAKLKTVCLRKTEEECIDDGHYDEWYNHSSKWNYGEDTNWDEYCAKEDDGDTHPCARFYRKVYSHPEEPYWCEDATILCPFTCDLFSDVRDPGCNLSVDRRFDLNRDGRLDTSPPDVLTPAAREKFGWQWMMVMAFREEYLDDEEVKYPDANINAAEGIILHDLRTKNTYLDVDSDLKEETIISLSGNGTNPSRWGPIVSIQVLDEQEGDLDFTLNDNDFKAGKPAAGLTEEAQMYSFVRGYRTDPERGCNVDCNPATDASCEQGCGTYLLIEEGKLLDADTRQFVRSVQKKDQIDVITRVIQLTNDTNRLCDANGIPEDTVDGYPNPIEICCNNDTGCKDARGMKQGSTCYESRPVAGIQNTSKTCMFEGDMDHLDLSTDPPTPRPLYPKIYVRSKVADLHGRKWVTDTSEDQKPFND